VRKHNNILQETFKSSLLLKLKGDFILEIEKQVLEVMLFKNMLYNADSSNTVQPWCTAILNEGNE